MFELYQLCVYVITKTSKKNLELYLHFDIIYLFMESLPYMLGTVKDPENLERNECNKSCFCKHKTNSLRGCCDRGEWLETGGF